MEGRHCRCTTGSLIVSVALMFLAPFALSQEEDASPPSPDDLTAYVPLPGLPSFRAPFLRLKDDGGCRFLSLSPNTRFLALTTRNDEVHVFDLATGDVTWEWAYPELLSTSLGVIVWPFSSLGRQARELGHWRLTNVPGAPRGWPGDTGALFAPDGRGLAIVHNACLSNSHVAVETPQGVTLNPGVWLLGGYVHFFDDPDLKLRMTVEVDRPRQLPLSATILHGLAEVTAFAYSPDGRLAVTGSAEGVLTLWDVNTGVGLARTRAESQPEDAPSVNAVPFSPDSQHVASIGASGTVRLWSATQLAPEAELTGHTQPGFWVGYSPDGACVASAALDGELRIWDPATHLTTERLDWRRRAGEDPVFAYDPRGSGILFAATRDGAVAGMLPDGPARTQYVVPLGLSDVAALAVSSDGNRIAIGDREGHILVFQTG
jgi:WD40 repeat protein